MATTKAANTYEPEYAVPPGETLLETIEELGMDQRELATRLGLSAKHVNQIIKGHAPITHDTAIGLERVTGVPAHFWNNREMLYQERLAKINDANRLKSDLEWLKIIPTKELLERRAITQQSDKAALLRETLKFFGVSSTEAWNNLWLKPNIAARRSRCLESHPGPTSVWLRLGELEARNIECSKYDVAKFKAALSQIRSLTTEPVEKVAPEMQQLSARSGVAVVFVREIKHAPWYGASLWQTPTKAIIELSLRGKSDDQFWFSFFHEAGHILHDSKKEVLINDGTDDDPREKKANKFAEEFLIPPESASEIPFLRSRVQVQNFAESIGIATGIVVGQYQRRTGKYDWFNALKRKLVWSHE